MKKKKGSQNNLLEAVQKKLDRKATSLKRLKRELEIEAALEKVRARTMAMQKSDELPELANLVFEKLEDLDFGKMGAAFIGTPGEDANTVNIWIGDKEYRYATCFRMPYHESPVVVDLWNAKTSGKDFISSIYPFQVKNQWFQFAFTQTDFKRLNEENKRWVLEAPCLTQAMAFGKNSMVGIHIHFEKILSASEIDILKRFSKVFEQGYTRFLDLLKAEDQARESQIQLALERVRTRTMAMQHSDELVGAATVMFSQLEALGIAVWSSGFNIWEQDGKAAMINMCNPDGSTAFPYLLPHTEDIFFIRIMEARQRGDELLVMETGGKELEDTYNFMFSLPQVKKMLGGMVETGFPIPKFQVTHCAFFSQGYLMFITYEPVPQMWDVFKRFAKVFDLTYTRFNDLKKAEAQSREAQIELALERVRAKTMAMQKSEELGDVAVVMFKQVEELGIHAWVTGFNIWNEGNESYIDWVSNPAGGFIDPYTVDLNSHPIFREIRDAKKRGADFGVFEISGKELEETYALLISFAKKQFEEIQAAGFHFPARQINHYVFGDQVGLMFITLDPCPDAWDIFKRFGKVFEQTYTRFLDLQRAEAQLRESLIEAALERVRSRTMAMQHSDELKDAAGLLFRQVKALGVPLYSCGYNIWEKEEKDFTSWMSTQDGRGVSPALKIPLTDDANFIRYAESKNNGETFFVLELRGERMQEHYRYLINTIPVFRVFFDEALRAGFLMPETQIHHLANFSHGNLLFITLEPCPGFHEVFKRFAAVFEQTYTRFLDLQKAEAQARESQIEAALERVRSRSMAMQKSDELQSTAAVLFRQVAALGVHAFGCGFNIWDEDRKYATAWMAREDGVAPPFKTSSSEDIFLHISESANRGDSLFVLEQGGEDLDIHYRYMSSIPVFKEVTDKMAEAGLSVPTFQVMHCAFFTQGYLMFITFVPVPEAHDIFKRFAKVFEQTYTRFLDLQKAEVQSRESQIQLALERVRARTMAMQKSDELAETVFILFQQFKVLGENPDQATIGIINEKEWVIEYWVTMYGNQTNRVYKFSIDEPNVTKRIYTGWKEQKTSLVIDLGGKELYDFTTYRASMGGAAYNQDEKRRVINVAFFSKGLLNVQSNELRSAESILLLERFAKVFEQTYTRFLDLKQAEAQARESQIEAALERVRSRTMAMQRSEELAEVARTLFQQVKSLGIPQWTCGLSIWELGDKEFTWYPGDGEGAILPPCKIPLTEHWVFIGFDESRKRGDEFMFYEKRGEVNAEHYRYMMNIPVLKELLQGMVDAGYPIPDFQVDHIANFSHGNLAFITYEHYPEMHDIFKRFAKVFEQTYTRFLDLQKAEAQVREAIQRASVDRVRAEIASMRRTADLDRITPLIWNELNTLGVPFIRCGVFIMDEEKEQVISFLSTPDGKAIASYTSTFSGVKIITQALPFWRRKQIFKTHWDEAEFLEQAKELVQQGAVISTEAYLTEKRPKSLDLHFLPFLQGMLYVGNTEPLNDEHLQLVQALAEAFSTAYARYEDFNKLESANTKIEKTLVDLKQAQSQLIQSEKMASLGELTAGIAHEIQNPLNFVNNFSEINKELIGEISEAVKTGDQQESSELLLLLLENEEKISHHGRRADSIVKGMLQHSRASTGQKELTDINALADEYLRLAYHGIRSKDNSFNATMVTDFDKSIGVIKIIPQDIGRVLLNLYNNAFYAVAEKAKISGGEFKPTITVGTRQTILPPGGARGASIEISVKDNGPGIPQKVVDKIFQPFFTTKPTGQGTGLGLSLSYDIIKAHGGEIRVETKEGEGSEFIFRLLLI